VTRKEMLLVDSGGQYLDGTTDVTRTIHLGSASSFEREAYSRVVQGHIRLSQCVFPVGTSGAQLDVLARSSLWSVCLNYGHGTGHGVGAFLNVHEGPHGISTSATRSSHPLMPGMLVTNEPGYYKEGSFGIRVENVLLVKEVNEGYMCFEPVTLLPIQQDLILEGLLSAGEEQWLEEYNNRVLEQVGPLLTEDTLQWLRNNRQYYRTAK
jgi:Xaa-Pro aminopeptidase